MTVEESLSLRLPAPVRIKDTAAARARYGVHAGQVVEAYARPAGGGLTVECEDEHTFDTQLQYLEVIQ
jgi:hypothetical protein